MIFDDLYCYCKISVLRTKTLEIISKIPKFDQEKVAPNSGTLADAKSAIMGPIVGPPTQT